MATFTQEGNKTVKCHCGYVFSTSVADTIFKCPMCGSYMVVRYHGTLVDSEGNYVY